MVTIANKKIPDNKNVLISLTYLYGIGSWSAQEIIKKAQVENKKTSQLAEVEIGRIRKVAENFLIEGQLREKVQKNINEKIRLGTYQGSRHVRKLPLKQRTRHNAQTAKKGGASIRKRIAVAGKKKAPSPK